LRFIETQTLLLGPLCPHTCEHVWGGLLKRDTLLVQTPLPAVTMTAAHQASQNAKLIFPPSLIGMGMTHILPIKPGRLYLVQRFIANTTSSRAMNEE
jgi:hypothetical protein